MTGKDGDVPERFLWQSALSS